MRRLAILFALSLSPMAFASEVTIQTDVTFSDNSSNLFPESFVQPALEAEFLKEMNAYCAQWASLASVQEIKVLSYRNFISETCPATPGGGQDLICDDKVKLKKSIMRASLQGKVTCIGNVNVTPTTKVHSEKRLNANEALKNSVSGSWIMNITHSTGCGMHDFFVSQKVDCSTVKAPAHQNLNIEKDATCIKVELLTDNNCEAATTTTVEVNPNSYAGDLGPWNQVILVNSENTPFLVNGMMGDLTLLPLDPKN